MALIGGFMILNNEEEQVKYALESFVALGDLLGTLSLVDNNSTDATLEIIDSFSDRMHIIVQHEYHTSHHGNLRNKAMDPLTDDQWIFYLDGDESFSSNFPNWLRSGKLEEANAWGIYKYTTIIDRFHYVEGGNGPTWRLFRNLPGRHFPQSIHTEPTHLKFGAWPTVPGVYMFDHTACKSREALWTKGYRYQWAARENVPAIGGPAEYIVRVDNAYNQYPERNVLFPEDIRNLIFTGP